MAGKKKAPRYGLYWCTTEDGDEDWFVVASSARAARRYHECAEGYESGEALCERIATLPAELHCKDGWKDGPKGEVQREAGWPSDDLLTACGGEIAQQPRGGLRDEMQVVCKDVRFGERVFRAGDIVTNVAQLRGVKEARLSVFQGQKRG